MAARCSPEKRGAMLAQRSPWAILKGKNMNVLNKTKRHGCRDLTFKKEKTRGKAKYISLVDCEKFVCSTISSHKLSDFDKHIIGTIWAHYIDRRILKEDL